MLLSVCAAVLVGPLGVQFVSRWEGFKEGIVDVESLTTAKKARSHVNGSDSSDDGEFEEDCEAGPGDSSEPGDTDDLSGIARTAAKMPADVAATIPKVPNRLRSPSGRQTAPIPHMKAAATTSTLWRRKSLASPRTATA